MLQLPIFLGVIIVLTAEVVWILIKRKPAHAASIYALAGIVVFWSTAYLLQALNPAYVSRDALKSLNYFFLSAAATAQLFFAFSYANRTRWLSSPAVFGFFIIEPVLTQAFFWTKTFNPFALPFQMESIELFNFLYVSYLLAACVFLLVDAFLDKPRSHFQRAWMILPGSTLTILGNTFVYIYGGAAVLDQRVYITTYSYALTIAGFAYGLLNSRLIESTPMTRDAVVQGMDDGWMVVDQHNKIIDLNPSAERMVGVSRNKLYGTPVDQVLRDWNGLLQSSKGVKEMDVKRTVRDENDSRYLNIRISQLFKNPDLPFGYLVVWRDVTERKLEDEARQRARDELFVLLNAISSLSSRSMKLDDFLSESIYQIIYSFQSKAVAVFLTEKKDGGGQILTLRAHFGIPPESAALIGGKSMAASVYGWLLQNAENRPLLLTGRTAHSDFPLSAGDVGFNYAALIPLVVFTQNENSVIGCLYLGRDEGGLYNEDEIVRLTTIANQIAMLIDSESRRQAAIALGERQRLLRDLHDSVSQKLYGLVALTEAAQAGIEAGSQIEPLSVLTRIGENARQAVKEMRLFLYQMQPVDLKDGLAASLQHRLSAVEGRADIKARMLSDEDVQMDKEREIALYYIAQEALNNILRHAHARNVWVNLKQTHQNVALEIKDDGRGFDPKKADTAGLGLRNMKERAEQVNGKLKITSKSGKGTKVVVSLPRKA